MMSMGEFLKLFFAKADSGFIELYYIIPKGVDAPRGKRWQYGQYAPLPLNRRIPDVIPSVISGNRDGYGVYFGVTASDTAFTEPEMWIDREGKQRKRYPRRKETNVHYITALWADLDHTTLEAASERLTSWQYTPSIIVQSGGGIHAYWLLDSAYPVDADNRSTVKRLLQGIAVAHAQQGADKAVKDLARVMRLPGTVNTKPERNGARCEVVTVTGELHNIHDLYRQFRLYMPTEVLQSKREIITTQRAACLPPKVQAYLNNPPAQGERNRRLFSAARACVDALYSQAECDTLLRATAALSGLDSHEIDLVLNSAYRYAPEAPRDKDTDHIAFYDHLGGLS